MIDIIFKINNNDFGLCDRFYIIAILRLLYADNSNVYSGYLTICSTDQRYLFAVRIPNKPFKLYGVSKAAHLHETCC